MYQTTTPMNAKTSAAIRLTKVIYVLYGASFLVGISFFVAIILNYAKQDEVRGTFLESHLRWQIRTFWISLIVFIIGFISSFVVIGIFILFANAVWFLYRLVKGYLHLIESKPMY
jgi:uncharacterized membrane protein